MYLQQPCKTGPWLPPLDDNRPNYLEFHLHLHSGLCVHQVCKVAPPRVMQILPFLIIAHHVSRYNTGARHNMGVTFMFPLQVDLPHQLPGKCLISVCRIYTNQNIHHAQVVSPDPWPFSLSTDLCEN